MPSADSDANGIRPGPDDGRTERGAGAGVRRPLCHAEEPVALVPAPRAPVVRPRTGCPRRRPPFEHVPAQADAARRSRHGDRGRPRVLVRAAAQRVGLLETLGRVHVHARRDRRRASVAVLPVCGERIADARRCRDVAKQEPPRSEEPNGRDPGHGDDAADEPPTGHSGRSLASRSTWSGSRRRRRYPRSG